MIARQRPVRPLLLFFLLATTCKFQPRAAEEVDAQLGPAPVGGRTGGGGSTVEPGTGPKDGPEPLDSGGSGGTGGGGGESDSGVPGAYTCDPGSPCAVVGKPCVVGATVCGVGGATCAETTKLQANGSPCGEGAVCLDGLCSPCKQSSECSIDSNPCFSAAIECSTGRPLCTESGFAPNGTNCGAGMVCREGACMACETGDSCQPANPCHEGTLDCTGGIASCRDNNRAKPAGDSCGPGKVCGASGQCIACNAGMECNLPNEPCRAGKIECSTGTARCVASGDQANGKACGNGQVCRSGSCEACSDGMFCTPANKCHLGKLSCTSGRPVCVDMGDRAANGTGCGENLYCSNGACVSCTAATSCTVSNPCKTGITTCDTGTSQCLEDRNRRDGTNCGEGRVCQNGVCQACGDGMGCTPANKCHLGRLSCATGSPVCSDAMASAANGSDCGVNLVCNNGNCVPCTARLDCQSPCQTGITSCGSGTSQCVLTANKRDGTGCGAGRVCQSGSCEPCGGIGQACCGGTCNGGSRCANGDVVSPVCELGFCRERVSRDCNSCQDCVGNACVDRSVLPVTV
jgi:hypothetical protein